MAVSIIDIQGEMPFWYEGRHHEPLAPLGDLVDRYVDGASFTQLNMKKITKVAVSLLMHRYQGIIYATNGPEKI
ncbi:MAG: hypothetical protein LUQ38_01210 [Methanotrichaceae archaeon]|nr:hypothetical protein [Methanotrichaceae archaeon]